MRKEKEARKQNRIQEVGKERAEECI